ncbi:MAG TPA: hypothetical protein VG370_24275 [Chloroflexota bacterium]|jgi:hypothetical protein|nr:hypothetical protein [Chloroflexota bacterium]
MATIVAAAGVGLIVSTGCALHATGAGTIRSANRVDQAKFAFSFNGPKGKLSGTFFDRGTGDRLKFDGLDAYVDEPGYNDQCIAAYGRYESRTEGKPGGGTLRLIACDGAAPGYDDDMVEIAVLTGPLAGYLNAGELLHGNIKTHNRPQPVPGD